MNSSLTTFWANNGTKVLGSIIAIVSGIAGGSVALPPPLNAHSAVLVPWAVFINTILGLFVAARGFGNTQAIASQVVQQHVNAIAVANQANMHLAPAPAPAPPPRPAVVTPVIASAGNLKGFARLPFLLALLAICLTACAALGLAPAQSPQQGIAYGYSGVTAALTTLASLTTSGVVSSTDSIKANNAILAVKALLDQANAAATSSAPLASTILTTATADLAQVSLYLTCKQQKGASCQL